MAPSSRQILLVIFPYSERGEEEIRNRALAVLGNGGTRRGTSEKRNLAYHAGRAAAAEALRAAGFSAKIEADSGYGFLRVVGQRNLFLNISHTDNIAVACLGSASVGVDIESKHREVSKVLKRVAIAEELQQLERLPFIKEEIPSGIALWSAKEAFSKALGMGIKFGLHDFVIDLSSTIHKARTRQRGPLSLTHPAVSFETFGDYVIAICSERELLNRGIEQLVLS